MFVSTIFWTLRILSYIVTVPVLVGSLFTFFAGGVLAGGAWIIWLMWLHEYHSKWKKAKGKVHGWRQTVDWTLASSQTFNPQPRVGVLHHNGTADIGLTHGDLGLVASQVRLPELRSCPECAAAYNGTFERVNTVTRAYALRNCSSMTESCDAPLTPDLPPPARRQHATGRRHRLVT